MSEEIKHIKQNKLDLLQALRALAALLVVIDHSILTLISKAGFSIEDTFIEKFVGSFGTFGVSVFFAISGFIMIHTNRKGFGSRSNAADFLVRRFVRVVPLYWLTMFIYILKLTYQNNPPSMEYIFKSFLFIPYLDADNRFRPIYGLGWTLNYEMFFYAIFAFSMILSFKKGVFCFFAFFLLITFSHNYMSKPVDNGFTVLIYFWTDPIILYFMMGAFIGLLHPKFIKLGFINKYSFLLGFILIIILMACLLGTIKQFSFNSFMYFTSMMICTLLVIMLCILGKDRNQKSIFSNMLCFLGDASYSIYLTHSFLIGPSARVWSLYFSNEFWPVFILLMLCGASILGGVVHVYIEKKIASRLKHIRVRPSVAKPLIS